MFGISFGEMIVILIIALIVIGPERLPTVVRTVGRWVGKLRGYTNNFRSDIEREFQLGELREDLERFRQSREVSQLRETLQSTAEKGKNYLKEVESGASSTWEAAQAAYREQKAKAEAEKSLGAASTEAESEALGDEAFIAHESALMAAEMDDPTVMTKPPAGFKPTYHPAIKSHDEIEREGAVADLNDDESLPYWTAVVRARQLAIVMEEAPYPMYLTYHLNQVRQARGILSEAQCETLYRQRLIELNSRDSSH